MTQNQSCNEKPRNVDSHISQRMHASTVMDILKSVIVIIRVTSKLIKLKVCEGKKFRFYNEHTKLGSRDFVLLRKP